MSLIIREATVGDLHNVVMGILALKAETIWRDVPSQAFAYEPVQAWILGTLTEPSQHLWVADVEGAVVGFCGAGLTTQRFLPDVPYLEEWALRVLPSWRASTVAGKLWRRACAWGRAQGAAGAVRGRPTARGETLTYVRWRRNR